MRFQDHFIVLILNSRHHLLLYFTILLISKNQLTRLIIPEDLTLFPVIFFILPLNSIFSAQPISLEVIDDGIRRDLTFMTPNQK